MKCLLSLGVEDMEDRAHQQIVRREIPVISTALPVRVDQHVRDELRIPHVIRPLANLEQRAVHRTGLPNRLEFSGGRIMYRAI